MTFFPHWTAKEHYLYWIFCSEMKNRKKSIKRGTTCYSLVCAVCPAEVIVAPVVKTCPVLVYHKRISANTVYLQIVKPPEANVWFVIDLKISGLGLVNIWAMCCFVCSRWNSRELQHFMNLFMVSILYTYYYMYVQFMNVCRFDSISCHSS